MSYHFGPNHGTIPKKKWYGESGKKMTAGGYSQRSKRYRTVIRGRTFNLATDFGPRNRDWWEGKGIMVPAAKLYIDRHPPSVPPSSTKVNFRSRLWETDDIPIMLLLFGGFITFEMTPKSRSIIVNCFQFQDFAFR